MNGQRFPNSQQPYAECLIHALRTPGRWLDLGCGHDFLPPWMDGWPVSEALARAARTVEVVGIDLDRRALHAHATLSRKIVGDIEQLPFAGETFDLVSANMVVEHVRDPVHLFHEVRRVLRPGGTFLIHTPNALGYTTRLARCVPGALRPRIARILQGRHEADVYRTFYRANTIERLQHLAVQSGLACDDVRAVNSSPQFYRSPTLRRWEERLLERLADDRHVSWRPCIIARFARPLDG
jgi:SAM-dependent methyltransferase